MSMDVSDLRSGDNLLVRSNQGEVWIEHTCLKRFGEAAIVATLAGSLEKVTLAGVEGHDAQGSISSRGYR